MLTGTVLKFDSEGASPLAHARPILAIGFAMAVVGADDSSDVTGTAETVQWIAEMIITIRKVRGNMLRDAWWGLRLEHYLNHVYGNRSISQIEGRGSYPIIDIHPVAKAQRSSFGSLVLTLNTEAIFPEPSFRVMSIEQPPT